MDGYLLFTFRPFLKYALVTLVFFTNFAAIKVLQNFRHHDFRSGDELHIGFRPKSLNFDGASFETPLNLSERCLFSVKKSHCV